VFSLDSLVIVAKLVGSALICRIVTAFEISGIRKTVSFEEVGGDSVEIFAPNGLHGEKED
jgi:hypothetical protein